MKKKTDYWEFSVRFFLAFKRLKFCNLLIILNDLVIFLWDSLHKILYKHCGALCRSLIRVEIPSLLDLIECQAGQKQTSLLPTASQLPSLEQTGVISVRVPSGPFRDLSHRLFLHFLLYQHGQSTFLLWPSSVCCSTMQAD